MPNPLFVDTLWDPGLNARYNAGRNDMRLVKVHKTAGNTSYGVCKNNGLCQWLVPYVGVPWQFAEADAICYDSGPYNGFGPGIEIEAPVEGGLIRPGLSEFRALSASQVEWTGRIFRWLHDEWGVPLDLYDGPRFQGKGFVGFENHGDLDDQRTDGVTREEWDAMVGAPVPPVQQKEEDDMKTTLVVSAENPTWGIYELGSYGLRHLTNPKAINEMVDKGLVTNKRNAKGEVVYVSLTSDAWTAQVNGDEILKRLTKLPT